ncbi:malate synthase [Shewanella sp. D64]|uniref:malate synthase n=1 Tax=unclassified Shewanella TaxID=196818 RepID=UPI0022BA12DA|nr:MULTISPECIES: malate synthase [unclassified Shewanella]MEC4725976.1 malate synthase [Shewanella sp. D64]MEC4737231.1 malate synthase [Shewanella sp. E94]WBJ93610.1 malate synthase [Shewanella sp. MTB7]
MNTSTMRSTQNEQQMNDLISADVVSMDAYAASKAEETKGNAKEFLDTTFPLATGSHKDVSSYVVYYQNLLMFFKDGTHSGLRDPRQFVALNGHKSEPAAILLQDKGTHVALTFDRCGISGSQDSANIDDIQLEGHEYWISLLNIDEQNRVSKEQQEQMFTAKDGSDYQL